MDPREPDRPAAGSWDRIVDVAVWCLVIAVLFALGVGANRWFAARFGNQDPTRTEEWVEPLPREAPGGPSQPSVGPNGEVVQSPVWTRQPVPEYPRPAMRRGIESGSVMLRCKALASGALEACVVLSEQPAGAGFAEAALHGVRSARIQPRSVDGLETDSTIQFTVRFRVEL